MPGEHFVLKDLSFYERAREADAKACHLDQREEKRQERTPRKAPVKERAGREEVGEKGRESSPAVRSLTAKKKKKKTIAQALQVVSPALDF